MQSDRVTLHDYNNNYDISGHEHQEHREHYRKWFSLVECYMYLQWQNSDNLKNWKMLLWRHWNRSSGNATLGSALYCEPGPSTPPPPPHTHTDTFSSYSHHHHLYSPGVSTPPRHHTHCAVHPTHGWWTSGRMRASDLRGSPLTVSVTPHLQWIEKCKLLVLTIANLMNMSIAEVHVSTLGSH